MGFGKRQTPPGSFATKPSAPLDVSIAAPASQAAPGNVAPEKPVPPLTSPVLVERFAALRDHLNYIHAQASELAEAIVERRPLAPTALDIGFDVTRAPISIHQFERHFHHRADGRLQHGCYGVMHPSDRSSYQPKLQLSMLDMTSAITKINMRYAMASKDDALTIALQSPAFTTELDCVIVLSAVIGTLIDTMIRVQPLYEASARGEPADFQFDADKERLARAIARARTSMLDPAALQSLIPALPWPMLGVEMGADDHEGQIVFNEVYFPEVYAKPLMARVAQMQAEAMRISA